MSDSNERTVLMKKMTLKLKSDSASVWEGSPFDKAKEKTDDWKKNLRSNVAKT